MNDFTKEELIQIMWAIHDNEFPIPVSLGNKIQTMIDKCCECEESERECNLIVERCIKCGNLFII